MVESEKETIRVWEGERLLLPTDDISLAYHFRCIHGVGYLRLMSRPSRQLLYPGSEVSITGGEVATVTGKDHMIIEMRTMKQKG